MEVLAALRFHLPSKKAFKKFDQDHEPDANISDNVSIDEHVKMNDSYMRTGWYVPKKK